MTNVKVNSPLYADDFIPNEQTHNETHHKTLKSRGVE